MNKAIRKYLASYAEDTALLGKQVLQTFEHVLVIPAYGEGPCLDQAIASIPCLDDQSVLAVVVINEREDSCEMVRTSNRSSLQRLRQYYANQQALADDAYLCETPFGAMVLLQVTLPKDQGVGLARKLGGDFAFGAWSAGKIRSPWMHCTDADVQLPPDYFGVLQSLDSAGAVSAMVRRFRHYAVDDVPQQHMQIYDAWLRLHVLGLHWAGSPYGFHCIGSTISVQMSSYASVRGFPKRNAAEDFYFLNKLAKLGSITSVAGAPIQIAARVSQRVPFGTGRAMQLAQSAGVQGLPQFYHPQVYLYLKCLLAELERSVNSGQFDCDKVKEALKTLALDMQPFDAALNALDFVVAISKRLQSSKQVEQRRSAVHGWFDAFRTMKFIHHLRDNGIQSVDIDTALHAGEFLLQRSAPQVHDDIEVVQALHEQRKGAVL